jgi:putative transposase
MADAGSSISIVTEHPTGPWILQQLLRRLIRDYISYYHADRIHDSLEKDTPAMRPVSSKPGPAARLVSLPRIGGLHHRYDPQQAA